MTNERKIENFRKPLILSLPVFENIERDIKPNRLPTIPITIKIGKAIKAPFIINHFIKLF
jgi:hypothetical protein